jgi:hypothetical protein
MRYQSLREIDNDGFSFIASGVQFEDRNARAHNSKPTDPLET